MKTSGKFSVLVWITAVIPLPALNAQPTTLRTWTLTNGQNAELKLENAYGETAYFTDSSGRPLTAAVLAFSEADQAEIVHWSRERDRALLSGELEPGEFSLQFRRDARERIGDSLEKVGWNDQPEPDFYAVYTAAASNKPCLSFTPHLVQAYKSAKESNGDRFEMILCSWDDKLAQMLSFMEENQIDWYGNWSKRKSKFWAQYEAAAIPCLVLVDRNGYILSHSYRNGEYVGPEIVLDDLAELLPFTGSDPQKRLSVPTPGVDMSKLRAAIEERSQLATKEKTAVELGLVLHPKGMLEAITDPNAPVQEITVKVKVSELGIVQEVSLAGIENPALNAYLFKALLLWQFLPAIDADGSVRGSSVVLPLRLQLKEGALDPPEV